MTVKKLKYPLAQFLLIVFVGIVSVFASGKTDSLYAVLQQTKDKKIEIRLINTLAWELKYSDIDSSQTLAEKALSLALQMKDNEGQVFAYRNLTAINAIQSNWEQSIMFAQKGMEIAKKYSYIYELAKIYNLMGLINRNLTNYSDALYYHNLALGIYREMNDEREVAGVLNNIGLIYTRVNDISKSLRVYFEVLNTEKKLNNEEGVARTLNSIANVYKLNGDLTEAIDYYSQAAELCEKTGNNYFAAANYHNLASVYYSRKQDTLAIIYLTNAIEKNKILQNKQWLLLNYQLLGNIEFENKNYPAMLGYYAAVDSLLPLIKDRMQYCKQYQEWAKYYLSIRELEKAKFYILQSLKLAEELNLLSEKINSHHILYEIYKAQGQISLALEQIEKENMLNDSLQKIEKEEQVNDLKVRYETDIKIRENEYLLAENSNKSKIINNQRYLMAAVSAVLFFVVLLSISIYRSRQRAKKAKEQLEILNRQVNDQKKELEIKAKSLAAINERLVKMDKFKEAMTHMLVHDLKNPLNIMVNLPLIKGQKNKDEMILQSSRSMLNLIMNMLDVSKFENDTMKLNRDIFPLSKMLHEAFMEVAFLFKQKNIKLNFIFESEYRVNADYEILKRTMVNLFSNAVKYSPVNSEIVLEVKSTGENELRLELIDKGQGIPKEYQTRIFEKFFQVDQKDSGTIRSTGIGLTFCKIAVEAHGGMIGVHSESGNGSTFWFTLPAESKTTEFDHPESNGQEDITNIRSLSKEELKVLHPYIEKLRKLEVYAVSDIQAILKEMEQVNFVSLNVVLPELHQAVATCSDVNYTKLLNSLSIEPE